MPKLDKYEKSRQDSANAANRLKQQEAVAARKKAEEEAIARKKAKEEAAVARKKAEEEATARKKAEKEEEARRNDELWRELDRVSAEGKKHPQGLRYYLDTQPMSGEARMEIYRWNRVWKEDMLMNWCYLGPEERLYFNEMSRLFG